MIRLMILLFITRLLRPLRRWSSVRLQGCLSPCWWDPSMSRRSACSPGGTHTPDNNMEKFLCRIHSRISAVVQSNEIISSASFCCSNTASFVFCLSFLLRPVCGIRGKTLIINLPGSKKGSQVGSVTFHLHNPWPGASQLTKENLFQFLFVYKMRECRCYISKRERGIQSWVV